MTSDSIAALFIVVYVVVAFVVLVYGCVYVEFIKKSRGPYDDKSDILFLAILWPLVAVVISVALPILGLDKLARFVGKRLAERKKARNTVLKKAPEEEKADMYGDTFGDGPYREATVCKACGGHVRVVPDTGSANERVVKA